MTKNNFNSKKFIAFIFSMLTITGILVYALFTQTFGWPMVAFMCLGIAAIAVMSITYVNKQGTLDKFITLAKGISTNAISKPNLD